MRAHLITFVNVHLVGWYAWFIQPRWQTMTKWLRIFSAQLYILFAISVCYHSQTIPCRAHHSEHLYSTGGTSKQFGLLLFVFLRDRAAVTTNRFWAVPKLCGSTRVMWSGWARSTSYGHRESFQSQLCPASLERGPLQKLINRAKRRQHQGTYQSIYIHTYIHTNIHQIKCTSMPYYLGAAFFAYIQSNCVVRAWWHMVYGAPDDGTNYTVQICAHSVDD